MTTSRRPSARPSPGSAAPPSPCVRAPQPPVPSSVRAVTYNATTQTATLNPNANLAAEHGVHRAALHRDHRHDGPGARTGHVVLHDGGRGQRGAHRDGPDTGGQRHRRRGRQQHHGDLQRGRHRDQRRNVHVASRHRNHRCPRRGRCHLDSDHGHAEPDRQPGGQHGLHRTAADRDHRLRGRTARTGHVVLHDSSRGAGDGARATGHRHRRGREQSAGAPITATANWPEATNTGGSPITGYRIRALRMSAAGAVLATTTSAVQPATARIAGDDAAGGR